MHYTILYRGPLESCNYGCEYCPFAKRSETYAQLQGDRDALNRFVGWVAGREATGRHHEFSVFFTPWGEALIRDWYQRAIARLSRMSHVRKVAIQTNLSCHLQWLNDCNLSKVGLWCTYHPTETTRERFLRQCAQLDERGARYSVGIVGLREHLGDAFALRRELSPDVYLWVNAYKRIESYYAPAELHAFESIDPLFPVNNTRHPSRGRACLAGEQVFSVDGDGTMRRCHFIKEPIGNLYDDEIGWERALAPRACTNDTCGCHIGYVHMPELGLYDMFGEGVLERIPSDRIWNAAQFAHAPITSTAASSSLVQVSIRGR